MFGKKPIFGKKAASSNAVPPGSDLGEDIDWDNLPVGLKIALEHTPYPREPNDPALDAMLRRKAQTAFVRHWMREQQKSDEANGKFAPITIDCTNVEDVKRAEALRDSELHHYVAQGVLVHTADPQNYILWLIEQMETDRATLGWIFLWMNGGRFLQGLGGYGSEWLTAGKAGRILQAICERSERRYGIPVDEIGLSRDFESERLKCLTIRDDGLLAPGLIFPDNLLGSPFPTPKRPANFTMEDGVVSGRIA